MRRITLLHEHWEFTASRWPTPPDRYGFSTLEWLPAKVPGHVHVDLVQNGVIADPFTGLAELGAAWVDEEDFSYRTRFEFTPDPTLPRRVLRFSCLDTVAAVFLNGERVAEHDNMFVPLELDVTERLRAGTNELRVEFQSAARVGRERRARYLAAEGGMPENLVRFDERAFVRKSQYMFGWDWGPRLVSAGVAGNVELLEYAGRILDVVVEQRHPGDGSVELTFRSESEGGGRVVHFLEGYSRPVPDGEVIRLESPELWWPAGLGPQRLHTLRSLLVTEEALERGDLESAVLDAREIRIGLRTVRLVREPDAHGESFYFVVNGRPLWAVGANWIPDDSFPAVIGRERLRTRLSAARDMNMNMLRVWGGGLYETEDFYDLCDELGLLVWQDFPYACSYYPDDSANQAVAREEARAAVRRLRRRASLAIWCGNNENLTMWQDKWGGAELHPPRYYGEPIYEQVLADVVRELDPERPYIPSSPFGGERANGGGFGDQHYWDVWHGRGDWKYYEDSTARFSSEFGFAAAPTRAAFRRMFGPSVEDPMALDVRHPVARFHDKTAKGYETFVQYVELHYPTPQNLEEWSYSSQLNQRDALRHGIEHYRRSDYCKGSLIWQINDCWPVQSWAVIDSEGEYKAAAYELRRLYAPVLLSLVVDKGRAELFVAVDNATEGVTGTVALEAHALATGAVLSRWEAHVEVAPNERRSVLAVELGPLEPETTLLFATFGRQSTFRLLSEPKHARLSEPRLTAEFTPEGLAVETDVPVVDLFVWDDASKLHLLDNFVTLPAPGRVVLRTRGSVHGKLAARSLRGPHALDWER